MAVELNQMIIQIQRLTSVLQKAPLRKDSTSTSCLSATEFRKKHRTFKVHLEIEGQKKRKNSISDGPLSQEQILKQ